MRSSQSWIMKWKEAEEMNNIKSYLTKCKCGLVVGFVLEHSSERYQLVYSELWSLAIIKIC